MKIETRRLNAFSVTPEAMDAMMATETYLAASGLDKELVELVKLRVSQINGCVFCIDMHYHQARSAGVTEFRLAVLPAWKEALVYSDGERAALAWAEAMTRIETVGAPDFLYSDLREEFSDAEIADLTIAIAQINSWNRIAIGLGYTHRAVQAA